MRKRLRISNVCIYIHILKMLLRVIFVPVLLRTYNAISVLYTQNLTQISSGLSTRPNKMAASCEQQVTISGKKKGSLRNRSCMRCGGIPNIVVRLLDPLCKTCFEEYFVHKFRAVLGKARAIQYGEKVLIALSGGPSSSAMLQLVRDGLSAGARRKLKIEPSAVFVDEGMLTGDGLSDDELSVVRQTLEGASFPCYFVSLESVFKAEKIGLNETAHAPEIAHARELKTVFSSLTSLTAREDMLESLRSRLLVSVARQYRCTKIMVGDSSTRLSVRLLSNVSQGRGGTVPLDTSICDDRHDDVAFIRPMREFTAKEIAYYNYCNGIVTVALPSLSFGMPINASINRLTEQLIAQLQSEFPSTVNTIFSTGNKLTVTRCEDSSEAKNCVLCASPLPSTPTTSCSSAVNDLEQSLESFPHKSAPRRQDGIQTCVSDLEPDYEAKNVSTSCESCSCSSGSSTTLIPISVLTRHLCYGCVRTVKECGVGRIPLPACVARECERREQRTKMKDTIKDFLLDVS
ncbi:cytoplasmic tRNA 2-thiolation protein 2-A-like [Corticium candelabrum]|uniref:cytoplasmic tRNA 2-thiolation protein 2-A-like n=1 Tax=Corticium candelabrum TaxID=121492 RepID=UPI002E260CF5|nr:cytoplasmic tRNA 2-thiolation protein 2-A-like [Corticium candelabrum]